MYGDSIYVPDTHIKKCHRTPAGVLIGLTQKEKAEDAGLNSCREMVEHQFASQDALFSNMKFFLRIKIKTNFPIDALYTCRVLFTNFHACFNGNQTGLRLNCEPPTIEHYMQ